MIVRNLERRPVKAALSVIGIAFACAILMVGGFFSDAIDRMVTIQFKLAQRDDMTVTFVDPTRRRPFMRSTVCRELSMQNRSALSRPGCVSSIAVIGPQFRDVPRTTHFAGVSTGS
jgi:hypothetical protein